MIAGRCVGDRLWGTLGTRAIRHTGLLTVIGLLVVRVCAGLMCAQCETTETSRTCMTLAPAASHCEGADGAGTKAVSCMITKIKNQSGEIIRFVRGCTAVRVGEGCVEHPDNKTVCYSTCDTDNCNVATVPRSSLRVVIYAVSIYTTVLQLCT